MSDQEIRKWKAVMNCTTEFLTDPIARSAIEMTARDQARGHGAVNPLPQDIFVETNRWPGDLVKLDDFPPPNVALEKQYRVLIFGTEQPDA